VQGVVGDCWFLAAASAIAEKPWRLEQSFSFAKRRLDFNNYLKDPSRRNTSGKLNPWGFYTVNFFTLGVPHSVRIDDWIALNGTT